MAGCLTAPRYYLNQCWLTIKSDLWHSPENNFTRSAYNMCSGIALLKLLPNLPGVSELIMTTSLFYTIHPKNYAHHDDIIKWKHFPCYWPFVQGIHWSPVNSPHKGQWNRALMFSLICAWISACVNNHEAGDLRRHRAGHYGGGYWDCCVRVGWSAVFFTQILIPLKSISFSW